MSQSWRRGFRPRPGPLERWLTGFAAAAFWLRLAAIDRFDRMAGRAKRAKKIRAAILVVAEELEITRRAVAEMKAGQGRPAAEMLADMQG